MVDDLFHRLGCSPAACLQLLQDVSEDPASHAAIRRLKEKAQSRGLELAGDAFERALLACAATETAPRIEQLPLYASVKPLLRDEFRFYTDSPTSSAAPLEIRSYMFALAAKTISLRRFPAGPLDWEVSGFPRSWLVQIRKADLPRTLAFLLNRVGGFAPMFFVHVARRPKNRSLIIEREVLRSYYRIVRSLELQPEIKGILAHAWFHDPAAVQQYPHLEWLNRPYVEAGGLIITAGPADADSGFAEYNVERQQKFAKGELAFKMGIAIWPRQSALEWARRHPELET